MWTRVRPWQGFETENPLPKANIYTDQKLADMYERLAVKRKLEVLKCTQNVHKTYTKNGRHPQTKKHRIAFQCDSVHVL